MVLCNMTHKAWHMYANFLFDSGYAYRFATGWAGSWFQGGRPPLSAQRPLNGSPTAERSALQEVLSRRADSPDPQMRGCSQILLRPIS